MTQEEQWIEQEWQDYINAVTESGLPLWLCDQYRGNRQLMESRDEREEPGFMASLEEDSEGSDGNTSYPDDLPF